MRILGHSKGSNALSWFSFKVLELGPERIETKIQVEGSLSVFFFQCLVVLMPRMLSRQE